MSPTRSARPGLVAVLLLALALALGAAACGSSSGSKTSLPTLPARSTTTGVVTTTVAPPRTTTTTARSTTTTSSSTTTTSDPASSTTTADPSTTTSSSTTTSEATTTTTPRRDHHHGPIDHHVLHLDHRGPGQHRGAGHRPVQREEGALAGHRPGGRPGGADRPGRADAPLQAVVAGGLGWRTCCATARPWSIWARPGPAAADPTQQVAHWSALEQRAQALGSATAAVRADASDSQAQRRPRRAGSVVGPVPHLDPQRPGAAHRATGADHRAARLRRRRSRPAPDRGGRPPDRARPAGRAAPPVLRLVTERRPAGGTTVDELHRREELARADGRARQDRAPARRRASSPSASASRRCSTPARSTRSGPWPARPPTTTRASWPSFVPAQLRHGSGPDRRPTGGGGRRRLHRPRRGRRRHHLAEAGLRRADGPRAAPADGPPGRRHRRRRHRQVARHRAAHLRAPALGWQHTVDNLATVPVVAPGPRIGRRPRRRPRGHQPLLAHGPRHVARSSWPDRRWWPGWGEPVTKEELGGDHIHGRNGVVDDEVDTEAEAFARTRRFLSYLPSSVHELAPRAPNHRRPRPPRRVAAVGRPPERRGRSTRSGRSSSPVVDRESWLRDRRRLRPGRGVRAGPPRRLARRPCCRRDPNQAGRSSTADASDKVIRFVDLSDTFHLPVVHLVDQPGFMVGRRRASGPAPSATASGRVAAIYQAPVPWCSVIIRKVFGVAGAAHQSRHGCFYRYAWPSGTWGSLPIEGGVEAAFKAELEAAADEEARPPASREITARMETVRSPFRTAEAFVVEEIIDPRDTRPLLCEFADLAAPAAPARRDGPDLPTRGAHDRGPRRHHGQRLEGHRRGGSGRGRRRHAGRPREHEDGDPRRVPRWPARSPSSAWPPTITCTRAT